MQDISVGLKLYLTGRNTMRGSVKGHRRLPPETKELRVWGVPPLFKICALNFGFESPPFAARHRDLRNLMGLDRLLTCQYPLIHCEHTNPLSSPSCPNKSSSPHICTRLHIQMCLQRPPSESHLVPSISTGLLTHPSMYHF